MSKPAIVPDTTASGIAVDPKTLERVIPESRRPDGTIRKEKKIRPGYTPQEDVRRFRGTRQAQLDVNTLPKGHIIGWAPPPSVMTLPPPKAGSAALTKAQKKNEKRKEKRKEKHEEVKVKDNWEDEDEDELKEAAESTSAAVAKTEEAKASKVKEAESAETQDVEGLAEKLEKLEVQ